MAQQLTGTLSGIVNDQTGARIPNAKVELKKESSGETRGTVSDKEGYFNITAVQPATYSLFVSAPGFTKWEATGIVMNQGDQRAVANIELKVAAVGSEAVTVISGEDVMVPLDTGEISTALNAKMISDIPLSGRNAGEVMKMMPGFGRNNGLSQGQAFNATGAVDSNSGPAGDFSSNGTQPNGTMAYMLDGSNLIDPGNLGTQVANINPDMVEEIKVLTTAYSAEYAKGPVIFEAFSKTGTSHYHGEGYLYARNSALNSWDWYTKETFKSQGGGSALQAQLRPDEHYFYYGGNVGGPVVLPFVKFNKGHDKLFFWFGYEYMDQHPASTPIAMNVPTSPQLTGDFTNSLPVSSASTVPVSTLLTEGLQNSGNANAYSGMYNSPGPDGSHLPSTVWDANIKGLIAEGAYPTPNVTPGPNNSWNDYVYAVSNPANRYEITGKATYDFSENTKLNASYSRQIETMQHPLSVWWAPQWTVPYPSPVVGKETGNFVMGNLTHVFSPTTTNEFVFNYSRWVNASTLSDPARVNRTTQGFNVGSIFTAVNGKTVSPQIPNIEGPWGGALSNIDEESFYSGFGGGTAFGGVKLAYAAYDNFTKIVGTHSLKAGGYWDFEGNQQSGGNPQNGTYNLGWGADSTGNLVADMLTGRVVNYQESSADPTAQLGFDQWSFYGQDSWKADKQLTLNYGIRFDHEGQWNGGQENGNFWFGSSGNHNVGFQVWDLANLVNAAPGSAPANSGLEWNAIDKSIPLSGFSSKPLTINPRVGFAYDIKGDGKTVLRGGYSVFQYQVSAQIGNAWNGPQGAFTYQANGPNFPKINGVSTELGYGGISLVTPPGGTTENGASVYAMQKGDNRNPYTSDWDITISRSLPWRSVFEVSYVGNESRNLYQDGSNSHIGDLNNVRPGAQFLQDPVNGNYESPAGPACSFNVNATPPTGPAKGSNSTYCVANPAAYGNISWNDFDWAPYKTYEHMYVMTHSGYASYHSLQANWQKQSGPVTWVANYTFGKAMGVWDYMTSNGAGSGPNVDTFNVKDNYGPLAYDHTQILNLSYIWNTPNFIKNGSQIIRQVVNGWQISGYTGFQSGAPIQQNTGGNMNAIYPGSLTVPYNDLPLADNPVGFQQDSSILLPNGLRSVSMNTATWFGTDSQRILLPVVTCDPRKGLKKGQYFNVNCFAPPAYGQQGTLEWPYIKGPAYFDSDLAIYKSFQITGTQSFQLRISATNFLNHPLKEFNASGGNSDVQLNFSNTAYVTSPIDSTDTHELQTISQTNTNAQTTGAPLAKVGSRSVLFSAKYIF
jgi:molybdopterin-binding protein